MVTINDKCLNSSDTIGVDSATLNPLAALDGPTSKRGKGSKGEGRCYAPGAAIIGGTGDKSPNILKN